MDYSKVCVKKPWGEEYLCYKNEVLAIWMLYIRAGAKTSLHCHPNKHTGLVVLNGDVEISFLRGSMKLKGLDKVHIFRGRFHSTKSTSVNGSYLLEVETPEDKQDLVRLDDDYGRTGKSYEGKEFHVNKSSSCLWIGEPEIVGEEVYHVHGNAVSHVRITTISQLTDFPTSDMIIIARGGLKTQEGSQILWPGDVVDGFTLKRLASAFELIQQTTAIHLKSLSHV